MHSSSGFSLLKEKMFDLPLEKRVPETRGGKHGMRAPKNVCNAITMN
jgi:hypothetical protein